MEDTNAVEMQYPKILELIAKQFPDETIYFICFSCKPFNGDKQDEWVEVATIYLF